jgi:TolA-binding protein
MTNIYFRKSSLCILSRSLFSLCLLAALANCSTLRNSPEAFSSTNSVLTQGDPETQASPVELRKLVTELNERIQSLETKLSSLNDKWDAHLFTESIARNSPPAAEGTHARTAADSTWASPGTRSPASTPSASPGDTPQQLGPSPEIAANRLESKPLSSSASSLSNSRSKKVAIDAEGAFIQDDGIQLFRKARVYSQALQHSEAILTFSDFLEKYPDHALASAAQFQIAESYRLQNEKQLALQEYRKLLHSYERSSYVSDTLKQMSLLEEALQQSQESMKHRQLLSSLFASSPAASEIEGAPKTAPQTPTSNATRQPNSLPPPTASIEGIP